MKVEMRAFDRLRYENLAAAARLRLKLLAVLTCSPATGRLVCGSTAGDESDVELAARVFDARLSA